MSEEVKSNELNELQGYNCAQLLKFIYPNIILLPYQLEELWKSMWREIAKYGTNCITTVIKNHTNGRCSCGYDASCYKASISSKIIARTDLVDRHINEWIVKRINTKYDERDSDKFIVNTNDKDSNSMNDRDKSDGNKNNRDVKNIDNTNDKDINNNCIKQISANTSKDLNTAIDKDLSKNNRFINIWTIEELNLALKQNDQIIFKKDRKLRLDAISDTAKSIDYDTLTIIESYLFYPRCIICDDAKYNINNRQLNYNQRKLVRYLCSQSKKCLECGVSILHHWNVSGNYYNMNTYDEYNAIMVEYLRDKYKKELICPFGVCKYCERSISSNYWPEIHRDSYSDKYFVGEVIQEFTKFIRVINCYYCPHCPQPECDYMEDDYKSVKITYFRSIPRSKKNK